jgi:hypothetical protein
VVVVVPLILILLLLVVLKLCICSNMLVCIHGFIGVYRWCFRYALCCLCFSSAPTVPTHTYTHSIRINS